MWSRDSLPLFLPHHILQNVSLFKFIALSLMVTVNYMQVNRNVLSRIRVLFYRLFNDTISSTASSMVER